nr:uncharacterized protein LOC109157187 [Ipomoea batatas]
MRLEYGASNHSPSLFADRVDKGGENEGENRTENSPSRSDASAVQVPNSSNVSSLVRRWRDFGVVAEIANSAAVNNNNYSISISRSNSTCSTLCDDSSIDGRLVQSSSGDGESDKSSSNVAMTMNQPSSGDIWTWGEGAGARGGLPNAEGGVEATEGQWPEQLSRPASREEADGERSIGHRAGQQASSRAPSQALLAFQFRISQFPNSGQLNTVLEAFGRVKTVRNNYVEVMSNIVEPTLGSSFVACSSVTREAETKKNGVDVGGSCGGEWWRCLKMVATVRRNSPPFFLLRKMEIDVATAIVLVGFAASPEVVVVEACDEQR